MPKAASKPKSKVTKIKFKPVPFIVRDTKVNIPKTKPGVTKRDVRNARLELTSARSLEKLSRGKNAGKNTITVGERVLGGNDKRMMKKRQEAEKFFLSQQVKHKKASRK